jgi:hypothetical protein
MKQAIARFVTIEDEFNRRLHKTIKKQLNTYETHSFHLISSISIGCM